MGKYGGAVVIYPTFEEKDLAEKPTDWNDAAKLHGNEWVAEKILSAVNPKAETLAETQKNPDDCPPMEYAPPDAEYVDYGDIPAEETQKPKPAKNKKPHKLLEYNYPFRVLGYNNGVYYYYPFGEKRIVSLTPTSHNMLNFFQLASEEVLLAPHRDANNKLLGTQGQVAQRIASQMMDYATKQGIFVEEDQVRGIGAWMDEGRVFLHCGSEIYINGVKTHFNDIKSEFTYIAAARLVTPSKDTLTNAEARKLREICEMVTWEKKLSGTLLAGWLVIAPICAALQFRPHICIIGHLKRRLT